MFCRLKCDLFSRMSHGTREECVFYYCWVECSVYHYWVQLVYSVVEILYFLIYLHLIDIYVIKSSLKISYYHCVNYLLSSVRWGAKLNGNPPEHSRYLQFRTPSLNCPQLSPLSPLPADLSMVSCIPFATTFMHSTDCTNFTYLMTPNRKKKEKTHNLHIIKVSKRRREIKGGRKYLKNTD